MDTNLEEIQFLCHWKRTSGYLIGEYSLLLRFGLFTTIWNYCLYAVPCLCISHNLTVKLRLFLIKPNWIFFWAEGLYFLWMLCLGKARSNLMNSFRVIGTKDLWILCRSNQRKSLYKLQWFVLGKFSPSIIKSSSRAARVGFRLVVKWSSVFRVNGGAGLPMVTNTWNDLFAINN